MTDVNVKNTAGRFGFVTYDHMVMVELANDHRTVHIDARRVEAVTTWREDAHGAKGGFLEVYMYSGVSFVCCERTMDGVFERCTEFLDIMELNPPMGPGKDDEGG